MAKFPVVPSIPLVSLCKQHEMSKISLKRKTRGASYLFIYEE